MARKPISDLSAFASLTLEGNLIAPAMIASVHENQAKEQEPAHYDIPRGLALRDEITRFFRIGERHFEDFARIENPGLGATTRFAEGFLREVFGFNDLAPAAAPVALLAGEGRVAVVVAPRGDDLDRPSQALSTDRRRSAAIALQDHLNAEAEAVWGLAINGRAVRLMRDNASLTRPSYIEADLVQIFRDKDAASFTALWLLIHRSRFGRTGAGPADCALERWREQGGKQGEAARNKLAAQVENALIKLGSGLIEENPGLQAKLDNGTVSYTAFFNDLLRIVYRLIFLMVAEDRGLLHDPKAGPAAVQLYQDGYSLAHLRDRAVRRSAFDRHVDRWEGMKIIFRNLATGEARLGLPALGGLFESDLPETVSGRLKNNDFLGAVRDLGWLRSDAGALVPVNWRAMETEELGSVYESLLELQPQASADGKGMQFAGATSEKKGNQRKTTGSYYTPDSLVQALLDSALDPVLDRAEASGENPAEALLALDVIDPACGSGHFLLAALRRIATRVARHRADGLPSAADYRHALRDVARLCIHGVDRNEMAVELTKVALWIETVDPGLPLGYFDPHIRCGDSLFGVYDLDALRLGVPDSAYAPLTGDDKAAAKFLASRNKSEKQGQGQLDYEGGRSKLPAPPPFAGAAKAVRNLPESSLTDVARRAAQFNASRSSSDWKNYLLACDLYAAAFLAPKRNQTTEAELIASAPTSTHVYAAAIGLPVPETAASKATLSRVARAFHWPLEFPDVMERGGFDAVIGNPPWERIKLQEQEFFAARKPEIAAATNADARRKMIAALAEAKAGSRDQALKEEFEQAKRTSEAASVFARVPDEHGGRFRLTGRGDVNTYALFAELFLDLAGPRGRAGVIVPTGIATDATTAPFFAFLVDNGQLVRIVSFENESFIFPSVHHSFRFCLLTVGSNTSEPEFCFFLRDPAQLSDPERRFTLSPADIALINPNTKTAPIFRTREDARLAAKIYDRVPVLIDDIRGSEGNPWGVSFMTMLHMSNDSGLFSTAAQLRSSGLVRDGMEWASPGRNSSRQSALACGRDDRNLVPDDVAPRSAERWVPLYEAKMIHQFDHRWATYHGEDSRDATADEKTDPGFEPEPRYWVPSADVETRLSNKSWTRDWLVGWRDITSAHVLRTVIVSVFPRVGVNHKTPLFLTNQPIDFTAALIGNLSSLVLDYFARQKVGGTSMTYFYLKQFPVLKPSDYTKEGLAFIVPRVLELTYTSWSLQSFARDLGHDGPPFAWNEDRRAHLRAELDAWYARAYGLTRDELRYVLDPADVMGDDYPSETFRVLKTNETRRFGEYRMRRLVLEAWDRMEEIGLDHDDASVDRPTLRSSIEPAH